MALSLGSFSVNERKDLSVLRILNPCHFRAPYALVKAIIFVRMRPWSGLAAHPEAAEREGSRIKRVCDHIWWSRLDPIPVLTSYFIFTGVVPPSVRPYSGHGCLARR